MNKLVYLIFALFIGAMMCSCSDTEEDVDINIISNGNSTIAISKGYKYLNAEMVGNAYKYNIYLMDANVGFADSTAGYTGTGSLIKFSLYSDNNFDVAPGSYTVDMFNSCDLFTAQNCAVFLNYNFAADTGRVCNITGGIAEFVNMGATIKIKLRPLVDHSEEMFVGTFHGVLGTAPR